MHGTMVLRYRVHVLWLAVLVLISGCAMGPQHREAGAHGGTAGPPAGQRIAQIALDLRGTPYRFGGDGPGGFDCSGLVHYAYEQAGLSAPRTAHAQYKAVRRLYVEQLNPGDLVFFRGDGALVSHVGIFVGEDRFVHALKAGEPVKVSRLDSDYWSRQLIRAGSLTR